MELQRPSPAHDPRLAALLRRGFFGRLPADVAATILADSPMAEYPRGTRIYLRRNGMGVAVVAAGLLRYYLTLRTTREITVRYAGPADMVGTVVPGDGGVSTGIQAVEPSALLYIDTERLMRLAAQDARVAMALLAESTRRLRFAYRRLAAGYGASVRSRAARDLLERAAALGSPTPGLRLRVSQQELADAIGSVREVVARVLRELRRERVIDTDRSGVTILNFAALEAEAGLEIEDAG
ncbi:MAG TPA: Crp/Fnr family transcriptional regulator [Candidatus Dormibacteraeota bacterium]